MFDRFMLLLGIVLWLGGWIAGKWAYVEDQEKRPGLVIPPQMIRVVCGIPQSRRLPQGVMLSGYVAFQLGGIVALLLAFGGPRLLSWMNAGARGILSMALVGGFCIVVALLIRRLWPYRGELAS